LTAVEPLPAPPRGLRRRRAASAAAWLLVALPFLLFAAALPQFGELPRNDYWDDFRDVLDPAGELSRNPLDWLGARSNEHWIGALLPVWLANFALTGGDNRGLAALSLALLVATFALLYRRLPAAVRAQPARRALWGLGVAAAVATPAAAHNWVLGFSGNQWFLANLLAVIALGALTGGARRARDLAPVALPLTLAAITHSTFLALALSLAAGSLLLGLPRRLRLAVLALALAAVALFFAGYERPAHHARPVRDPLVVATFTAEYLGGFLGEPPALSRAAGAAGLALLAAGALALRRRAAGDAPMLWPLFGLYGAAAALLTAVGRAGDVATQAAATSRYASLQGLFWLGTGVTVALALAGRERARRLGPPFALAVAAVLAANLHLGLGRLRSQLEHVRWQGVAALALRWDVRDDEVLAHVTPFASPAGLRFLRRLGHTPFDRPPEGDGLLVPGPAGRDRRTESGSWSTSHALPGRHFRLSGSLPPGASESDLVVLVGPEGAVVGAGVPVPRPAEGAGWLLGRRPPPLHWMGYAPVRERKRIAPVYLPEADPARAAAMRVETGARRLDEGETPAGER
jgi:hypothetical protein